MKVVKQDKQENSQSDYRSVKEKVLAAARSGLKHVILPDQNKNDWLEVPIEVRSKMKAHFVKTIGDVIPIALRPK